MMQTAWQRDGEGLDVALQIVDRQALALQPGQLGVEELAEAQDPDLGAGRRSRSCGGW